MEKIRVYPIYQNRKGSDYHRIKLPFMFSSPWCDNDTYQKIDEGKGDIGQKIDEALAASEIVVINRSFPTGGEVLEQLRKRHGFKVVIDMDDSMDLPKHSPFYKVYQNGFRKMMLEQVESADLVTVTTKRLKEHLQPYNKNIEVIPNAMPFGYSQFTPQPKRVPNDKFTFVYAGQISHLHDVALMKQGFKMLQHEKKISVQLAGYVPRMHGKPVHPVLQGMESIFKKGPNYKPIMNKELDDYMSLYDHADAVLIPLEDNEFNAHKSNLKILEAGCKGIPAIVSPVAPYIDNDADPEDLPPVLWAREPQEWGHLMKALSTDREQATELGKQLNLWVRKHYNLINWNAVRFEKMANLVGKTFKNDAK